MTLDEAKFILCAYRPGGPGAGPPALAEALSMASADPALGAWFQRSRDFDAAVSARLREIEPPAGLREAILAGARASGQPRGLGRRWAWAGGLAAAAALALVLFSMKSPSRPQAAGAAFASFAIGDLAEEGEHGSLGEPARRLVARLEAAGARMPGAGDIDFEGLRGTGCRTLRFRGRDVLEVCFHREGAEFHFYVARREGAAGARAPAGPWFVSEAGGCAGCWSDAQFEYAVASAAGVEAIRRLL